MKNLILLFVAMLAIFMLNTRNETLQASPNDNDAKIVATLQVSESMTSIEAAEVVAQTGWIATFSPTSSSMESASQITMTQEMLTGDKVIQRQVVNSNSFSSPAYAIAEMKIDVTNNSMTMTGQLRKDMLRRSVNVTINPFGNTLGTAMMIGNWTKMSFYTTLSPGSTTSIMKTPFSGLMTMNSSCTMPTDIMAQMQSPLDPISVNYSSIMMTG